MGTCVLAVGRMCLRAKTKYASVRVREGIPALEKNGNPVIGKKPNVLDLRKPSTEFQKTKSEIRDLAPLWFQNPLNEDERRRTNGAKSLVLGSTR